MKKYVVLATIFLLVLGAFSVAQDKKKDAGAKPAAQPAEKTPEQKAAEEEKALIDKIQSSGANPDQMALLCEEFCTKFPNSPNITTIHFMATVTHQRLNNFDKMEKHGLEALKGLPPNSVYQAVIMTLLANGYGENNKIDEAEAMAGKAMPIFESIQKPENVPQADWDAQVSDLKCTLNSTLGFAAMQRALKIDKADKEKRAPLLSKAADYFAAAIKLNPKDDISYFRMARSLALQEKVEKIEASLDAYAKAIALGRDATAKPAREDITKILESLDKAGQLNGRTVDGLVEKAKKDLGL